jgi:hypothetical protein
MSDDDQDDDLLKTVEMHSAAHLDPTAEIEAVLGELDDLLKNGEVGAALATKGINASVALLAAQGLISYLRGEKDQAADDFLAVSEEIKDRLTLTSDPEIKPN